jgi:hypothetical protein
VGSKFCDQIEAFARGESAKFSLPRDMVVRPKMNACFKKYAEHYQKTGEVQAERRLRELLNPTPAVLNPVPAVFNPVPAVPNPVLGRKRPGNPTPRGGQ